MVLQLSLMVFGYYALYCALYRAPRRARRTRSRSGPRFCLTRLTLRSTGPITEPRGNWERARVHTESIFREFNRSQFVDLRASFICVIERKRRGGGTRWLVSRRGVGSSLMREQTYLSPSRVRRYRWGSVHVFYVCI